MITVEEYFVKSFCITAFVYEVDYVSNRSLRFKICDFRSCDGIDIGQGKTKEDAWKSAALYYGLKPNELYEENGKILHVRKELPRRKEFSDRRHIILERRILLIR